MTTTFHNKCKSKPTMLQFPRFRKGYSLNLSPFCCFGKYQSMSVFFFMQLIYQHSLALGENISNSGLS